MHDPLAVNDLDCLEHLSPEVLDLLQAQPRLRLQEAPEVHVTSLHDDVDAAALAVDLGVDNLDDAVLVAQLLQQRHLILEGLQLLWAIRRNALQREQLARRVLHQVDLGAAAAPDGLHLCIRDAVDVGHLRSTSTLVRARRRLGGGGADGVHGELVLPRRGLDTRRRLRRGGHCATPPHSTNANACARARAWWARVAAAVRGACGGLLGG
mmetsp:Transcript_8372/g.21547  ORF Transcript_8372/g.21547 Transcript_8372/m.21547 type:complete len:210 (-) Transcript_8372:877-1506(-)